ncbi:hypothetical protein IW262DRAFT_1496487 [Armillaria fumosa]|nr:hypothetical protein IW262DRAFT_1496487 [Armillaria fumosa]
MTRDVGLSDIFIQAWLDDELNSQILEFFVHGQASNTIFEHALTMKKVSIPAFLEYQYGNYYKISKAQIYMGCMITALFTFSLMHVIATWVGLRRAYVFATSLRVRYDLWLSSSLWRIMNDTASGLNLVIADLTIIWRCWVVWGRNWKVIILPIFFVIGGIVCGANDVVYLFMVSPDDESQTIWAVALIAATVGTNILCTALIVGRILYVASKGQGGIMGAIRTYRGVLKILVESAALYSITFIVLMILYPLHGNGYMYPLALCSPVIAIAPTLIVLRIVLGQGHPQEPSLETQSSLHFNASRGSTIESTMDRGEEDMIQGNTGGTVPVPFGSVEQV